jgi:hypothetical protein
MSKKSGGKTPMTSKAAARIQSHADRTGSNKGFKGRAQAAAASNKASKGTSGSKGGAKK